MDRDKDIENGVRGRNWEEEVELGGIWWEESKEGEWLSLYQGSGPQSHVSQEKCGFFESLRTLNSYLQHTVASFMST